MKCLKIQRKSLDLRVLPDSRSETDPRSGIKDVELTRKCRRRRTIVITRYTEVEKSEIKCRFGCVGGVWDKNGPRIRNLHGSLWGDMFSLSGPGTHPYLTKFSAPRGEVVFATL